MMEPTRATSFFQGERGRLQGSPFWTDSSNCLDRLGRVDILRRL